MPIQFSWNEKKRLSNLMIHSMNFEDTPTVFEGITFTFEDDRFDYSERKFVTLGLLADIAVSIVHLETEEVIHVISFRKATRHETNIFFKSIQAQSTAESQDEKH